MSFLFLFVFFLFGSSEGGHVLLFPHYYPGDLTPFLALGQQLQKHGHRISVTLPDHLEHFVDPGDNFTFFTWGDGFEVYTDIHRQAEGWKKSFEEGDYYNSFHTLTHMIDDMVRRIFSENKLMPALYEDPPDVIITFPFGAALEVADLLNVPTVSLFTQSELNFGVPEGQTKFLAGITSLHSTSLGKMSLLDRAGGILFMKVFELFFWLMESQDNERRAEIHHLPPISQQNRRAGGDYSDSSIYLINGFWGWTSYPAPLYPSIRMAGPLVYKRKQKVLEGEAFDKLRTFLEESDRGVVYISLGTSTPITEKQIDFVLETTKTKDVLWALPERHQPFFQDYVAEFDEEKYHQNALYLTKWAPQYEILEHPKTVGFVTHGGQNGIYEAILTKKPCICGGVLFDQPRNCVKVQHHGLGLLVDFENDPQTVLSERLSQVMNNETFVENIGRFHKLAMIQGGPEEAVRGVEYVMEFRNETVNHLAVFYDKHNWIERGCLDLAFIFALFLGIVCYCCYWCLSRCCCGKKEKWD